MELKKSNLDKLPQGSTIDKMKGSIKEKEGFFITNGADLSDEDDDDKVDKTSMVGNKRNVAPSVVTEKPPAPKSTLSGSASDIRIRPHQNSASRIGGGVQSTFLGRR